MNKKRTTLLFLFLGVVLLATLLTADIAPVSTLNLPIDGYNTTSGSSIVFNCTAYDETTAGDENMSILVNVTLYGNWTVGWHANETNSTPANNSIHLFTKAMPSDGRYIWNCYSCDNTSNCSFAAANYTLTVDSRAPQLTFESQTTAAGNKSQAYVAANVTATDAIMGLHTIVVYLYNGTDGALINRTTSTSSPYSVNFSVPALANGLYHLNFTANDTLGNINYSSTRAIQLDTVAPTISNVNANATNTTSTVAVTFNLTTETTGISTVTINSTGTMTLVSAGVYQYINTTANMGCSGDKNCVFTYAVTDVAGNTNTTTITLAVDDVGPSIANPNTNVTNNLTKSTWDLNFSIRWVSDTHRISSVIINGSTMNASNPGNDGSYWHINKTSAWNCQGDGVCEFVITATDELGNADTLNFNVTVDDVAPTVTNPTSNATQNITKSTSTVNFTVVISDSNTVSSVLMNGTTMNNGGNNVWWTANETDDWGCTSGTCIFFFTATDELGNANDTEYFEITVDDTAPAILNPTTNVSSNLTKSTWNLNFTVTATDTNIYQVQLNGTPMTQGGSNVYDSTNRTAQLGCTGDGSCIYTLTAVDIAGNTNTTTILITVDDVAPSVTNPTTNATNNMTRSTDNINISVTVTETNTISSVYVNTTEMTGSSLYSVIATISDWATCTGETTCVIHFTANDTLGNLNDTMTLAVTVDDYAPRISLPNTNLTLSGNVTTSTANVNFTLTVVDANINTVTLNGTQMIQGSNNIWSTTNQTQGWGCTSGSCDLTFTAADSLGNTNTTTITLTIDDGGPTTSFGTATTSAGNQSVSWIYANVSATDDNLDRITIYLYNSTPALINTTTSTTSPVTFNVSGLSDGTYYLNASANDTLKSTTDVSTRTIVVDTKEPYGTFSLPAEGTYMRSSQVLNGTYGDATSGVQTIVMNVTQDGAEVTTLSVSDMASNKWNYTWATTARSDGNYTIYLVLTDYASNKNESVTRYYIIDNTVPTVAGVYVSDETSTSAAATSSEAAPNFTSPTGWVVINRTVTETNINYSNMTVDGVLINTTYVTNGTISVNVTGLSSGLHTIVFSAKDLADNTVSSPTTYYFRMNAQESTTVLLDNMNSSIGADVVVDIVLKEGGTDLSDNTTYLNKTFTLDFTLNGTNGQRVWANILNFSGAEADWNKTDKIKVDRTTTSSVATIVGQRAGAALQRMLLFRNATLFLPSASFASGATITFNQSITPDIDVLYIADDAGDSVYKLNYCSGGTAPTSITTSTMCYINTSSNVTLYIPHFSGGALANDTSAPAINISTPVNGSTVTNSYFTFTFDAWDGNPAESFCEYNLSNSSLQTVTSGTLTTSDATHVSTDTANETKYSYSITSGFSDLSNGDYNLTVNCTDLNNRSSLIYHSFTVSDSTAPSITAISTSGTTSTTSTGTATISVTVSERAMCWYASTSITANTSSAPGTAITTGVNTTSQSFSYVYTANGDFIYYVTCRDVLGNNMTTANNTGTVSVTITSSSSTPASSSSSGVRRTTPVSEIESTVARAWSDIAAGDDVSFDIKADSMPFVKVVFKLKSSTSQPSFEINSLRSKPSDLKDLKNAYKYLEIMATRISENLDSATITFKVPSSWASTMQSVDLYRYVSGQWAKLPTGFVGYDGNFVVYEAKTTGFSYFAIGGVEKQATVQTETGPEEDVAPEKITTEVVKEQETISAAETNEAVTKESVMKPILWLLATIVVIVIALILFIRKKPKSKIEKLEKKLDQIKTKHRS
ncbi:PGF-pre-PGF domain-containing protein [Candidatus Woesearchaeota archaeon]|nr:PGF-pre-PGF domain-containing protein [Candidatus Woesearchaeota archaeon]